MSESDATNSVVAITSYVSQILDEDLTGNNPANFIENEVHTVDVPGNKFVIRPACGSFYGHGVVVSSAAGQLVEGTGYVIRGINHGKTRVSQPQSGVYDYIVIISPVVGNVSISYHAFGGEITAREFNDLQRGLSGLYALLNNGEFITRSTLATQPVFVSEVPKGINARLKDIEEQLRHNTGCTFEYTLLVSDGNAYDRWVNIAVLSSAKITSSNKTSGYVGTAFSLKDSTPDPSGTRLNYVGEVLIGYEFVSTTVSLKLVDAVSSGSYPMLIPKFRIKYLNTNAGAGFILQMSVTGIGVSTKTLNVVLNDNNSDDGWVFAAVADDSALTSASKPVTLYPNEYSVAITGGSFGPVATATANSPWTYSLATVITSGTISSILVGPNNIYVEDVTSVKFKVNKIDGNAADDIVINAPIIDTKATSITVEYAIKGMSFRGTLIESPGSVVRIGGVDYPTRTYSLEYSYTGSGIIKSMLLGFK